MAYNYLLELYEILEKTRIDAERKKNEANDAGKELEGAFQEGIMDLAQEFEVFLESNYNRMLPRKIRERLLRDGASGMT